MLLFKNGEEDCFATGASRCEYLPTSTHGKNHRIFCPIQLSGINFEAALDTGAIGLICSRDIAAQIRPETDGTDEVLIRGVWVEGAWENYDITFLAEEGKDLTIQANVFFPNEDSEWPEGAPSFIGLEGCLDRMRFAVDVKYSEEMFYFGRSD